MEFSTFLIWFPLRATPSGQTTPGGHLSVPFHRRFIRIFCCRGWGWLRIMAVGRSSLENMSSLHLVAPPSGCIVNGNDAKRRFESLNYGLQIVETVFTYLLTYLLTELSPSWEAANCAVTQELPSILRNPKVHHRVYKRPSLVPILSQIDSVHTIPFCLSKIYFNIVHPPTCWSS
jgi:hypothetical protein